MVNARYLGRNSKVFSSYPMSRRASGVLNLKSEVWVRECTYYNTRREYKLFDLAASAQAYAKLKAGPYLWLVCPAVDSAFLEAN
jgi:hypothetical protein